MRTFYYVRNDWGETSKKSKHGTWETRNLWPSVPRLSRVTFIRNASHLPPPIRLPCSMLSYGSEINWYSNIAQCPAVPIPYPPLPSSLQVHVRIGTIPEKQNHWAAGSLRTGSFPGSWAKSGWVSGGGGEWRLSGRQGRWLCARGSEGAVVPATWMNSKSSVNWIDNCQDGLLGRHHLNLETVSNSSTSVLTPQRRLCLWARDLALICTRYLLLFSSSELLCWSQHISYLFTHVPG